MTIFRLFNDFLTNLPPPSISSYLTAFWVTLVDESVDELVLSIEVSGLGSELFAVEIDTLTRRVEPQSKATGIIFSWSASDTQSKATVLADEQCLERQRMT